MSNGRKRASPKVSGPFLKPSLHRIEKAGRAQFLVSPHSPIILAYPGAILLGLDGNEIRQVQYTETDHYRVTKQFLASPERYFRHLFSEDPEDDDEA